MLSNLDTYLEALRTSPLEFLLTLVYAVPEPEGAP